MLDFINNFKSAALATVDGEFFPHASYAPFVHFEHRYYIFISDLAKHAQNLQVNGEISLLFLEDESKSENIFARKRVSLLCESNVISRDDVIFEEVMSEFAKKFDEGMVKTLQSMQDFHLYEMVPFQGEAVFGFGEAYDVIGEHCEELRPRQRNTDHRS